MRTKIKALALGTGLLLAGSLARAAPWGDNSTHQDLDRPPPITAQPVPVTPKLQIALAATEERLKTQEVLLRRVLAELNRLTPKAVTPIPDGANLAARVDNLLLAILRKAESLK